MTAFEESLRDTSHVDFGAICTYKEEADEEARFMRLAKELKFFIRRKYRLEYKISLFFKAFIS